MITTSFSTDSITPRSTDRIRRNGFTLVEILVVILIIAILASLITAVIGNSLNSARSAATRATITKVHRLLEERRQTIARSNLRTETRVVRRSMTATPPIVAGLNNNAIAKVVAIKETMRAQLPQRLGDLSGPDRQFGTVDDSPVLAQLKKINSSFSASPPSFPSSHDDTTTSSELLYVALTMGTELGSGGTTIEFNSREAVDTDGDGLMELIDGWGKPLRFYRWPTDLVLFPGATPNANNPSPARPVDMLIGGGNAQLWNKDPDDPVGHFKKWITTPVVISNARVQGYFHAPSTYHVPLVVSAGQDGVLWLNEPHTTIGYLAKPATTDITLLSDSITNRNISIGGN